MNLLNYRDRLNRATHFLATHITTRPTWCVILGSGLGGLGNKLTDHKEVFQYNSIPGFPKTTVTGHAGQAVFGQWEDKNIVVMEGRYHRYEGHDFALLALPVRVMVSLGVRKFFITNAAGGIRQDILPGDLMLITDHLNLMGGNPLTGTNLDEMGPRFPAMTNCYSPELRTLTLKAGSSLDLAFKEGIYAALPGPSYETDAEINMLRTLGADAVGMSTVPEMIAIQHAGASAVAVSMITNATGGDSVPTHEEVVEMADRKRDALHRVILKVIKDAARGQDG